MPGFIPLDIAFVTFCRCVEPLFVLFYCCVVFHYVTTPLSIHSAIDGYLDSVQLGAIMNIAAGNILVLVLCRIQALISVG